MPLISAPARGYTDYQRLGNFDSAPIFSASGTNLNGVDEVTGILDVSRFAYLGGFDRVTNGRALVTLQWYADSAGAIPVGSRQYVLLNATLEIGNSMQYRVPNLGPFLKATWHQLSGTAFHFCQLLGTNRFHPLEAIPVNVQPITLNGIAQNPGSITYFPTDYVSGPVFFAIQSNVASVQFVPQTFDRTGNSQTLFAITPVAAAWTSFVLPIPLGAWQLTISVGGAAATIFAFATPSLSGAI